jgi:catechol 2,3-dioxygenase-like lactoylglutathione lyase family enzyme
VQWDGWILTGAAGIDEVVLDLLEWKIPPPPDRRSYPVPARTGFQRLRLAGGGTDGDSRRSHHCLGPDGLQVEIDRRGSARVTGVDVGCSDVGRTHSFYTDVVGLAVVGDATLSDSRGPEVFSLELVGTKQVPPRAPYELGIYRLAFLTDDIDRDHSELVRAGVTPYSPPVSVDLGPGLPAVRALCFADPDGATLELIEQPT